MQIQKSKTIAFKDPKYRDAWDYLEMCLIKGVDIPKEVLEMLYELVNKYYSDNIA